MKNWFKGYSDLIFINLFTLIIGLILFYCLGNKIEIIGAVLATGISLSFGVRQYKMENDKMFKELFENFNSRYDIKFNNKLNEIDAIVMHAPGTIKGDQSEFRAIEKVFGNNIPLLTTNKWKIGHTFGSSGMLSLELAILMLQNNTLIESPFYPNKKPTTPLKKILVNAVGFGGNAVSVVVSI